MPELPKITPDDYGKVFCERIVREDNWPFEYRCDKEPTHSGLDPQGRMRYVCELHSKSLRLVKVIVDIEPEDV